MAKKPRTVALVSPDVPADVRPEIIHAIDAVTSVDLVLVGDLKIQDAQRLQADLGIFPQQAMMLSVPFSKISRRRGGRSVGPIEVSTANTVGECVALVKEHVSS